MKQTIWQWIGGLFKTVTKDILPVVHGLLNGIITVIENPLAPIVAGLIPDNIGTDILSFLKAKLPLVAAEFDIIVDLSNASTLAEVNAELTKVFSKVGVWKDATAKEKFITSFGARLFQELHSLADGTHFTFGSAATLLEGFYQGLIDTEGNPIEQ